METTIKRATLKHQLELKNNIKILNELEQKGGRAKSGKKDAPYIYPAYFKGVDKKVKIKMTKNRISDLKKWLKES